MTGSSCERPVAVQANRVASIKYRDTVGFFVIRVGTVDVCVPYCSSHCSRCSLHSSCGRRRQPARPAAKIAAWPIGAAFCGAIATPCIGGHARTDRDSVLRPCLPSVAVPIGLYIDRLSAVMMVLISGIGTIIYTYSVEYMYQDLHERRYLALIG